MKKLLIVVGAAIAVYLVLLMGLVAGPGHAASETFYGAWDPVRTEIGVRTAALDACVSDNRPGPCTKASRLLERDVRRGIVRIRASVPAPNRACTATTRRSALSGLRMEALSAALAKGDTALVKIYIGMWQNRVVNIERRNRVCLGQGTRWR
jgi:hypothetical protein